MLLGDLGRARAEPSLEDQAVLLQQRQPGVGGPGAHAAEVWDGAEGLERGLQGLLRQGHVKGAGDPRADERVAVGAGRRGRGGALGEERLAEGAEVGRAALAEHGAALHEDRVRDVVAGAADVGDDVVEKVALLAARGVGLAVGDRRWVDGPAGAVLRDVGAALARPRVPCRDRAAVSSWWGASE